MKNDQLIKKRKINKKTICILFFILLCVSFLCAAEDFGLNDKVGTLVSFLNEPWVKGVACIGVKWPWVCEKRYRNLNYYYYYYYR